MAYRVLKDFTDLTSNLVYRVGDSFPCGNIEEISEERFSELAGSSNKRGEPVIEIEEVETFPQALPGGYYLLSNGDKVRGKEAAKKAEEKLISE